MSSPLSPQPASPGFQTNREVFPPLLEKLRKLIEDKVHILQTSVTEDQQDSVCEEIIGRGGPLWFAVQSEALTFDLQHLQTQTEQELCNIQAQLCEIEGRRRLLASDLLNLEEEKNQTDRELKGNPGVQTCTVLLRACRELQASIAERLAQSESLVFQQEALSALRNLLTQDLQRYQEETQKLTHFTQKTLKYHRSEEEEALVTHRLKNLSMQGKNETEQDNNMQNGNDMNGHTGVTSHTPESPLPTPLSLQTTDEEEVEQTLRANHNKSAAVLTRNLNLRRTGSVKDLIYKFSGPDSPQSPSPTRSLSGMGQITGRSSSPVSVVPHSGSVEMVRSQNQQSSPTAGETRLVESPVPSISVTPPFSETGPTQDQRGTKDSPTTEKTGSRAPDRPAQKTESGPGSSAARTENRSPKTHSSAPSGRESVADSGIGLESEFESNKQPDSPASEEEPSTPRVLPSHSQSAKYQLFLNDLGNGSSSRDADGPRGGSVGENGPRLSRWDSSRVGLNHHRGSLESLASRDWDTMSDRLGGFDSPPRVFNSPYTTTSFEYNPMHRMSEFKVQGGLSPSTSELNLFNYNGRSTSPVPMPTLTAPRARFSAYDTLTRRRADVSSTVIPNHMTMRSATLGPPNKRDYIEELTKQMDACQKRNQFLEAESVEMEKERNQIRFEMRGLLVNNEDLLRTNAQLTNEMKRMRERMLEMERESQSTTERYRKMEIELKETREMMVEANTQEYAFNFLQQSLKNRIQDAEESLEKQTLHAQSLAEKLWLAERQLEEFEVDKDTKDKKASELNSNILRLETELGEVLQASTQAAAELSLQQKLREDAQLRVDELEESLLEKDQELQRLQDIISRLQGEVSGKLIDKERTLEEEIQLRERMQLQWKQAERTVDDLHMELQTANQAKEDLAKQLKQAQEKMIDLESDLEEQHDSNQRWASKHKRALEQAEQWQMKVIQQKDLNEQLEGDKAILERQLHELRLEVEELQSSRIQEDVISKTESRAKELENFLRVEERNKVVLTNTITKLERKIHELSDQMEEEHRIATEQKDLMTQRIRSLKRQLNETEEDASRKEAQYRHTQRELAEERETAGRLQRQLLDQHLQMKRKESLMMRQTLDNLRLDLSVDEEEDDQQRNSVSKV